MKKKIVFTLTALTAVLVLIFSGILLFRRELTLRLSLVSVPISVSTLPPRHLITVDDLTWIDVPSAYLQADTAGGSGIGWFVDTAGRHDSRRFLFLSGNA